MKKKNYVKPSLINEKFVPQTYCASCSFTTYKIACLVNGNEDSDKDGVDGDHRSWGCQMESKQIITFDSNGYLQLYELENNYFAGGSCTLIASPSNDTPITLHKDNISNGQTIYWKTTGTDWGGWECIHQGTIDLSEDNKGNLT